MSERHKNDLNIKVECVFGHVELLSWLAPGPNGTMVGMGQRVDHHPDGTKTVHEPKPTGAVLSW